MAEVKHARAEAGEGRPGAAPPVSGSLAALVVALLLALVPVWRGVLDPSKVLFAVDTASAQAPWSSGEVRNGGLSDQGVVFYPAYRWVIERLGRGELPLWNPHVHLGAPALGNPQLGVLDPQVWALALLEALGGRGLSDWGLAWLAWLRIAAAGLGAWLLARALGLGRWGAALAGIGFGGSGFVVLWLNHSLGHVAPLLPWVLLGIERGRASSSARPLVGTALALALAVHGGHPETAFFVGLTGGVWALSLWGSERAACVRGLVGLALGTLLSATSWVPFLEYVQRSGAAAARSGSEPAPLLLWPLGALLLACGAVLRWREHAARASREDRGPDTGALALAAAGLFAASVVARVPWSTLVHDGLGTPLGEFGSLGFGGDGAYLERTSPWLSLPVLALALAGLFATGGRSALAGRLATVAALGWCAWLLALEVPALTAVFERVPGIGLAAPARAAVVSALMLPLLAGHALERAGTGPRLAGAALVLGGLGWALAGPVPPVPGEGVELPGDPRDELAWVEAPIEAGEHEADKLPAMLSVEAQVSSQVGAERLELVTQRWLGGEAFADAGTVVSTGDGHSAGHALDTRRLSSGLWRFALRIYGEAGALLGERHSDALFVRHRFAPGALSWALLAATLVALVLRRGRFAAPLVVGLALAHAAVFADGMNPAVPREAGLVDTATTDVLGEVLGDGRFLSDAGVLPPNTGMAFGLSSLGGYDGLDVASFNELRFAALRPGAHPLLDWTPRGVDLDAPGFLLLGARALVTAGPLEHPDWALVAAPDSSAAPDASAVEVADAETWVYAARSPLPRARLVRAARSTEAVRADPAGFDPRTMAFLPGGWSPAAPYAEGAVRELAFGAERIELEVELDGDGLLVVGEQAFPGWEANVDGEPRDVLTVNAAQRGVLLRAGDRRVELVYRPASLRLGALLALAAALALGVLSLGSRGLGAAATGAERSRLGGS